MTSILKNMFVVIILVVDKKGLWIYGKTYRFRLGNQHRRTNVYV